MAKKHVFTVTLAEGTVVPVVSGKRKTSLTNLSALFRKIAVGAKHGVVTLDARQSAVAASGSLTVAAIQANDTVTINGTVLTSKQQRATGTVTLANASVDDTVTVNGVVFTAKATADLTAGQFSQAGNDTADAASLAACINASTDASISGVVTATSSSDVVTIRAVTAGTAGNSITLVSSNGTRLAVSGSGTLTGGIAVANNEFEAIGTDTQIATDLVRAIGASTTNLVSKHVSATSALGVVTLTAKQPGHAGNAVTIATSNGTRLAITGGASRLTGGTDTLTSFTY